MSDVRPFRALRPRPELAERVAAPPYDVINSDEAREMAQGNEISFLHINKPEIDLAPEVSLYDDRVYAKGVANLRRFIAEGVFVREPEARFYVYQQRMGNHVQAGIVGAASCQEYADGLIKRHEFTRKDKEDDRTRHTHELNANAGPVFLTYRKRAEIDAIVDGIRKGQPLYDIVTTDGIGHTVWVVSPGETAALRQALRAVPALYVADGHHRAASAARVGLERKASNPRHRGDEPYNYFLAVLFPHDQLRIMDYNRVVKDLGGLTAEAFLARIGETFAVGDTSEPRPDAAHRFGMYLGRPMAPPRGEAGDVPGGRSRALPRRGDPAGKPARAGPRHRRPAHRQAHRLRRRDPRPRRTGEARGPGVGGRVRPLPRLAGPAHGGGRRRPGDAAEVHLVRAQAAFGPARSYTGHLVGGSRPDGKGGCNADPDLRRLRQVSPGASREVR